jgi:hypothetical protein
MSSAAAEPESAPSGAAVLGPPLLAALVSLAPPAAVVQSHAP